MASTNPFTTTAMIVGTLLLGGSAFTIPTLWSRAKIAQDEVMDVTIQLENARAELGRLQPELATSQQQVSQFEQQLESLRTDAFGQRQTAALLSSQIGRLQNEKRGLADKADRSEDLEEQVAGLEKQIESLTAEKAGLIADLKERRLVVGKASEPVEKSIVKPKPSNAVSPKTARNDPATMQPPIAPKPDDLVVANPVAPTRELYDDTGWRSVSRVITARPETTVVPGQVIIYESPVLPTTAPVITLPATPY